MTKAMMKLDDAQAHAHSFANEELAKYLVDRNVGKMLLDLAMMRPYRFRQLAVNSFIEPMASTDCPPETQTRSL
jgi:hypothetical protein